MFQLIVIYINDTTLPSVHRMYVSWFDMFKVLSA